MLVKLGRNKSAETHDATVGDVQFRHANSLAGLHLALLLKLHEQVTHLSNEPDQPVSYAEVLQALLDLANLHCVTPAQVETARQERVMQHGTFRKGVIMTIGEQALIKRRQEPG